MNLLNQDYWRLRDFEYAQPLYDLAFVLDVDAIATGAKKPKYRTFALWKAALGLDSYGTNIDQWLDGNLSDHDLDQVPSNRIKSYLYNIRNTGSIPELSTFLNVAGYERCLRLRRIRGLGPAQIAQTLGSDRPSSEWLRQASHNCNLPEEQILGCYVGDSYGNWQPPHLIPPLLRLLHAVEQQFDTPLNWELRGIRDLFCPITSECSITCDVADFTKLRRTCRNVVKRQSMFEIDRSSRGIIRVRHVMGWSARFELTERAASGLSAAELARNKDPLKKELSGSLRADLHLHTSWSDGAASLDSMAKAGSQLGLSYLAVTDHSRSSKVQGGLTPVEWFRQSSSLATTKTAIPVLHGIEVDILQDGSLDLPKSLLSYADFVVASVHSNWTSSRHANTRRLISAIETACIDVIGHPTAALTGKPGVPDYVRVAADVDWPKVFACCAKWQVAVEFNCFPSRFDLPVALLRKALDAGCWLSFGTDAHARAHLVHMKFGQEVADCLGADTVLNSFSHDEIRDWLRDARELRSQLNPTKPVQRKQKRLFEDVEDMKEKRVELIKAWPSPPSRLPDGPPIVGFDLTGSEKPTGVAYLRRNHVETCSLVSDDELIAFVRNKNPSIVSIDSPLGLPGGGKQINPNAGIVRVAEHDLSSIGISAYPALIDSMKDLTLRGIRLRNCIESMHPPPIVIESYPGAAQDILCIPRKQKSLALLREGLSDLGLTGPGLNATSHDEIDAITSALVGRYFNSGKFEAMGVPEEAQLIVPKRSLFEFEQAPIICLAGKTGAGKSVVARYLATFYGFEWCKTRELIRELLTADIEAAPENKLFQRTVSKQHITEEDLQDFGLAILDQHGQAPLRHKLAHKIRGLKTPIVVDAIRDPSDIADAKQDGRPILTWFVDSSDAAITARLSEQSRRSQGKVAIASPVDKTAELLRGESDLVISNSGTLEELRWNIDDAFFSHIYVESEA
ncbi:DNA polymerase/3'-5' exonuclease PolX [Symmachiella dynata]|uniref:DNA polymerase/3'-5' exonuclease PolX n=1 Tax=Symmachiella dynata TaxID=2527995 RepID=A0A517ZK28_9PLAN|nr:PHP domain-containing protein [Symmachiella dynata]QDU42850.1 DNA polymerase/3'-5' exonuclease PolX [Symmachiella dynata]